MKRKFVLIAALVAALAVVFISCPYPTNGGGESTSGGSGSTPTTPPVTTPPDTGEPSGPPAPFVVNNPRFTGWGGAGSTGENNVFPFNTSEANNCRITYAFPAEASGYTKITVEYTLTLKAGETLPMKITISSGKKDKWSGDEAGTDLDYPESSTTANKTYTKELSSFTNDCITIKHNTYHDESSSFTITITKITFSND